MRDATAKSQIRKHAMKDIGVSRRRPDKRRKGYIEVPLKMLAAVPLPHPDSTSLGGGVVDPFLEYPVELNQTGKKLVSLST